MSRCASGERARLPVRTLRPYMGAPEHGPGAEGVPKMQEPLLEHPAPAENRPKRIEEQSALGTPKKVR